MSDGPVAIETVFRAARAGDLSQLKKILAHLPVDCRDNRGETPLMVCADEGNLCRATIIFPAGDNWNSRVMGAWMECG
jgi:hypothetical protein